MNANDKRTVEQAILLRKMIADRLKSMTPQVKDRLMQTYLAQVRGPVGNAVALRRMTAAIMRAREANNPPEQNPLGDPR